MRGFVLSVLLLLSACQEPAKPEQETEQAGKDAARGQQQEHPPARELTPQPIAFADIEQNRFIGAGCAFIPEGGEGYDPVLYTIGERALVKLDGKPVTLAADTGSAEFPYGTRDRYAGGGHSFGLTRGGGKGELAGEEAVRWPGSLTIRDGRDHEVYRSGGTLECGA